MEKSHQIHLSSIIGDCGIYQVFILFFNFTVLFSNGSAILMMELCAPPVNIYWNWDANRTTFKSMDCSFQEIMMFSQSSNISNSSYLVYETEYSRRSLTEKLNLVCERSWIVSFVKSLWLLGGAFGSAFTGRISEKYGRTRVTILLMLINFISNLCMQFPLGWVMVAVASFIQGLTLMCGLVNISVQVVEVIPVSRRQLVGNLTKCGSVTGQVVLCGIAWIAQDWFYIQLLLTSTSALGLILSLFVVESPMWLMVRNRTLEAKSSILKMVQINQLNSEEATLKTDHWLEQMKNSQEFVEDGVFRDLFLNRTIIKYTICITLVSSCITFLNFGLAMNIGSFGSNLHLDIIISGGLSLAAVFITVIVMRTVSLKDIHSYSLLLTGIACVIYPFVYEYDIARTVIEGLTRAFSSTISALYLYYAAEVFPTSVRVLGTSVLVVFSRLLSTASPYTKELGENTKAYAPFILFGVISFAGYILNKFLPETKGKTLVQKVHDLQPSRNRSSSPSVYVINTRL